MLGVATFEGVSVVDETGGVVRDEEKVRLLRLSVERCGQRLGRNHEKISKVSVPTFTIVLATQFLHMA